MKKIIQKLEISFALLCVGTILIALLSITGNATGATNSEYSYPSGDVYLPLIQNNTTISTATPTATPTPTPTPTATPTVNPYP